MTEFDPSELLAYGRDPLTKSDRAAMASHSCEICDALLLVGEIGPHYRVNHPNDSPRVHERIER